MISFLIFAWVASVIGSYLLGTQIKRIKEDIAEIKITLEKKKDARVQDEGKSVLVDPLDIVQQAKYEHDQEMKRLNPDYDE